MIRLLFLAAIAAQTVAPPTTNVTPVPATAQAQAVKPEKPKLICVKQEVMGSLMPTRTCATAEEWKARRQREADRMDRVQDRTGTCTQC